mmetsp:Transcript_4796/g.5194  ORF Transcript_4796/g.5194 Transcript_4796/m.5194 type:complete len:178 (-) Transcript_4796:26-559(-)
MAGATADCFALIERLEAQLDEHSGQLLQAAVGLSKLWRTDKYLRHLNASLCVSDEHNTYEVDGHGNVLESDDGITSIGSGSMFAKAAARALIDSDLSAEEICKKAMTIAADMCVYTNHNFITETLKKEDKKPNEPKQVEKSSEDKAENTDDAKEEEAKDESAEDKKEEEKEEEKKEE